MSRYLYARGRGSERRVMHLTAFDPVTGQPTMRPLCDRVALRFDTTINVPLAQPVCKWCQVIDVQRTAAALPGGAR